SSLDGLSRIDDPRADVLHVVKYTTAEGLSSNNLRSITEDEWGRIYVGMGHGVDRLDTETGAVKHFTVADGLPKGIIETAFHDRQGALWFGSRFGLARLVPERQESQTLPSVYITGLRIEGVTRRISELGETSLPQFDLASNQNQVSVDFVGLGTSVGEELYYQYRLEGAANDWSVPTTERTVIYANLSPGTYRFMARAISADGQMSEVPAVFAFTIAAPIWMRWWFLTLAALAIGLGAYALYRYRVSRILVVANMRTRIATDLHDDIGSGLSRMAILSEVVKQQMGDTAPPSVPLLTEIAQSARDLVGSMRDIVWAIDPRQDDLSNVVVRVRQFASDVLEPQKIKLDFQVPPELEKVKLDPEQRRHLFLFFKEAINNIARHADCGSVWLDITVSHNRLRATIRDDGRGFHDINPQQAPTNGGAGGHGLENMRSRAKELGGDLSIDSTPGGGTCLKLTIPLKYGSMNMLSLR
ncbi:MAG: ATP-binding protein, partial [Acidobacteriota bacterium]